jgi:hypothetical protein
VLTARGLSDSVLRQSPDGEIKAVREAGVSSLAKGSLGTCHVARYRVWKGSSWLNERHMLFAWLSLIWVCVTDLYVYLVARGLIVDVNTWS